jgi:aminopeptidase N
VQNFFSIQSARYAVKRAKWRDVDLAVYHHPAHTFNVDRMLAAMQASLEYYSTNFSPYQFKQARILEFPAYATFAQAFANTMPYSEAIGFIADNRDPDDIDYATYVTAHEVAHQWWAHQVIGADMQGSTLLSETMAQYSALMVMKKMYGADQIRRFLKFELDTYLRSRGAEAVEELPLARVENQPYAHYSKGSLAMYLLQDEIGEAAVNRALARFLAAHAFKAAPYPRSSDLIALFREEAGPGRAQDLITDLFEKITLYDLKASEAVATRRADGLSDVSFKVTASKAYADGRGAERPTALAEEIDVGAFTEEPGRGAFKSTNVLAFEKRAIASGEQTITLRGLKVPAGAALHVGIDPYNKRIDRNSSDNVVKATSSGAKGP